MADVSDSTAPKISIIVPVYNVEKYLRRCLDSIASQTFNDWECILIDDGSPDNSGVICDEYAEKDSRFRVIHQKNAGVSAARNAGLDAAHGEWVGFVDSDDWIETNYVSAMYSRIKENNADIVICKNIADEYKKKQTIRRYIIHEDKDFILSAFPNYNHILGIPVNKLYRRNIIQNFNLQFPLGIRFNEDLYFTFSYCFYCKSICVIDAVIYHYDHCNDKSTTNNMNITSFENKKFVSEQIFSLLCSSNESQKYERIILDYKLQTKWMIVGQKNIRQKELWNITYPEVDKKIWQSSVRLDFKILLWLCSKGLYKLAYLLQDIKRLYVHIFSI